MTIRLTREQVDADLAAIVAEKGADYVYPEANGSCHYFDWDSDDVATPSCIIGHVLDRHDPDYNGIDQVNESDILALVELELIDADSDTLKYLMRVQNRQDNGTPWGQAVALG